jgi:hypothetical protein
MNLKFILRLARKHLPWMAALLKLIYYALKLAGEAVNYRVKYIRPKVPATQRQSGFRSYRSHTELRESSLSTDLAPLDATILLL